MKAFFGGQIEQSCRGDLAVVVNRESRDSKSYCVYICPQISDEFINLTGVRAVSSPLERAYIGVSHKIAEKIAMSLDDKLSAQVDLSDVDEMVVTPYFLNKYTDKPERIVLESTQEGYRVSEEK